MTVRDEDREAAHALCLGFRCMNVAWLQLHGHAKDCTRTAQAIADARERENMACAQLAAEHEDLDGDQRRWVSNRIAARRGAK